jgi:YD repeat-containing protein
MTKRRSLFRILTYIGFLVAAICIVNAAPAVAAPTSYTYDALNRLTEVEYADGTAIAYTYDAAGNRLTEVVDTAAPTVAIEAPTTGDAYTTDASTLNLSGTAADDTAVESVTWSDDRGGSGTAVGTTNWMVSDISLQPGVNVLTVTATDSAGKTATTTLTVTLVTSTPLATPTQEPTPNPMGSNTPAVSVTPTPALEATPSRTWTDTPLATWSPTLTSTPTSTATPTDTPTPTPTSTCEPTGTPYCSDQCPPPNTPAPGCGYPGGGYCMQHPQCASNEACVPSSNSSISGCCACATVTPSPTPTPTITAAPANCIGDCDGGGNVTVNEIVKLVDIVLGTAAASSCPSGIPPGQSVSVALIIRAVNSAVNGCP